MSDLVIVSPHDLRILDVVTDYVSLIWTDRAFEAGEFELRITPDNSALDLLKKDTLVTMPSTDRTMYVHTRELIEGENGTEIIIRGSSLIRMLDRRINADAWVLATPTAPFQKMRTLITNNIINPSSRQMFNLQSVILMNLGAYGTTPVDFPVGLNLYSEASSICQEFNVSMDWEIQTGRTDGEPGTSNIRFRAGVDRTLGSDGNTWWDPILFSRTDNNVVELQHVDSNKDTKTTALVHIDRSQYNRVSYKAWINEANPIVLHRRREMYFDAGYLADTPGNLTNQNTVARTDASKELAKHLTNDYVEFRVAPDSRYVYGVDYQLADYVGVISPLVEDEKYVVVEYTTSYTENGVEEYPTLRRPNLY